MNEKQRQARLQRWSQYRGFAYRRWRVYSTFLTGLLIGLFYVLLISGQFFPRIDEEGQRALVLVFSGILGGVIYTIVVDEQVEMPRFVGSNGDQFEAGLFGDILLGIAGAIVLDYICRQLGVGLNIAIEWAAAGMVGGYGGRAVLQFALTRVFKDINLLEADRQKYLQTTFQQKIEALDGLKVIDQLNNHIQTGLSNSELAELTAAIRQSSIDVRKQVFVLAKDARRAATLSDVMKPRIQRIIPIFEALIGCEPDNHQYYAEAAFACKDTESPDGFKVIQFLDKAIELRGDRHQAETWKYEMSRAITRIKQAYQHSRSYVFEPQVNELIIVDLLAVAKIYNLENIIRNAKDKKIPIPVLEWVEQNQATLLSRPDTHDLASQLLTVLAPDSISPLPKAQTDQPPTVKVETSPEIPKVEIQKTVVAPRPEGAVEKHENIKVLKNEVATSHQKINRATFFEHYRSTFNVGSLTQDQVDTFDAIFDYWDNSPYTDLRWLAYALATAYHETGSKMTPVREGFASSDAGSINAVEELYRNKRIRENYAKPAANGKSYFGRGLVQITHADNYKRLGQALGYGTKLYDNPSLALDKKISVELLFKGMLDGLYCVGHMLSVYFNSQTENWYEARAIINGDKGYKPDWAEGKSIGKMVEEHGREFYHCCQSAAIKGIPTLTPAVSSLLPLSEVRLILEGVNDGVYILPNWRDELKSAVRDSLIMLGILDASEQTDDDLLVGWGKFKKGVQLANLSEIGHSSAQLLLKALANISSQTNFSSKKSASLSLIGSVGRGGMNNKQDVLNVKERLAELGFGFFAISGKVDPGLIRAIQLFQSVILGDTICRGDGRVDLNGMTHTFLEASNAPRWIKMPIKGKGFVNSEVQDELDDNHDFGISWLADVIKEVGQIYEKTYRKDNPKIALLAVNDISIPQGGNTRDHAGHECGNACDLKLPHIGGGFGGIVFHDNVYDQDAARAQIQALRSHPLVIKSHIYFNDPVLISEKLCGYSYDHEHHIHFEIGALKPEP